MKKCCLILFAVLIFHSTSVFSQHIRIGIDPGLAMSRGTYKPDDGIDRRFYAGFDGGLLLEIAAANRFRIQPEVNFAQHGVELNTGTIRYTYKLYYITIPVLAKLNVCKGFNVLAGPQYGALLKAKKDTKELPTVDVKNQFKSGDFLVVLGGEFKFGSGFFLGIRANLGLSNVAEDNTGFEMKNQYASFRLGYMFSVN